MIKRTIMLLSLCALNGKAYADPLVQSFKDPAFNGYNWTTSVLQIRAAEESHKQANDAAIASEKAATAAAAANTPMAKFISLFTSQVYAQLATQLSNNLFAEGGASRAGTFVLDGNTISYIKGSTDVTLTVIDSTGNRTVVTVPIASFAF